MKHAFFSIHGHFYQPPRENPWLDAIEKEASAHPFHDWNSRIAFECYRPNAFARIVDGRGRILELFNNYSFLNFNFGPTLLSWIEREEPLVYQKIIEADRQSLSRWGHGNAIAQVYDHLIMPLANERDQETEVLWGIRFFERHFQRKPEAMWLPETAVNYSVLQVLFQHGMRYLILSPYQALRVKSFTSRKWIDVSGGKIDPTQPYRCFLKDRSGQKPLKGYLDLFFYDGALSKEVAFGDLLKDGDRFCLRVAQAYQPAKKEAQLIHLSTDGETYGHHKTFGEMALAYALSKGMASRGLTLTNYGAFLEKFPPVWEVEIDEGPKGEGTAWSCSHGVGRWKEDCGCSTGGQPGWNQKWRTPLREALNLLRDDLAHLFEEEGGEIFPDPWKARNGYIDVIMDRSSESLERFFGQYGHPDLDERRRIKGIKLLEMERHALRMFTSCGWFFADLSGLETILILQHAARAIELASEFTDRGIEKRFLDHLSLARSNLPEMGDGRQIYERRVKPRQTPLEQVVNHHAFATLLGDGVRSRRIFSFHVKTDDQVRFEKEGRTLFLGKVTVSSDLIPLPRAFLFGLVSSENNPGRNWIIEEREGVNLESLKRKGEEVLEKGEEVLERFFKAHSGSRHFTIEEVIKERSEEILRPLLEKRVGDPFSVYEGIYRQAKPVLDLLIKKEFPVPPGIRLAAEFTLSRRLVHEIVRLRGGEEPALVERTIDAIFEEARRYGFSLDLMESSSILSQILRGKMEHLRRMRDSDLPAQEGLMKEMIALLDASNRWGLQPDLWWVQNGMGEVLGEWVKRLEESHWGHRISKPIPFPLLIPLAERLHFNTERISSLIGSKR